MSSLTYCIACSTKLFSPPLSSSITRPGPRTSTSCPARVPSHRPRPPLPPFRPPQSAGAGDAELLLPPRRRPDERPPRAARRQGGFRRPAVVARGLERERARPRARARARPPRGKARGELRGSRELAGSDAQRARAPKRRPVPDEILPRSLPRILAEPAGARAARRRGEPRRAQRAAPPVRRELVLEQTRHPVRIEVAASAAGCAHGAFAPTRPRVVEAVVHGALAQRGDRLEVLPLLLAPLPRRLAVPDAPGLELHEELALVRLDLAPVEVDERVGEKGDVVAVLGIARERAPAHVQASELDAAKQRGLEVPRALDAALLEREDAQERQVLDRARVTQRRVAAGVEDAKRAPERGEARGVEANLRRGMIRGIGVVRVVRAVVPPLRFLGGDVELLQGDASLEVVDDGEAVAVEVELGEGRASLEALYARDAVVLQVEVRQLRQALDPGEARDDVVVEVQDAHAGRDARDGLHVPADPAAVEVEVREPGEVRLDGLVEPAPGARALDAREHHLPRHVPPVARVSPVARVPPVARVGRRVHPGRGPPARGDAEEDPDRARAREVGREAHVERPPTMLKNPRDAGRSSGDDVMTVN